VTARTWLKVTEVAKLLRVGPMTVYRMIDSGELSAIRFGGGAGKKTVRVPAAAMAEFLTASWVGEIPDGYRLTDLLGELDEEAGDGDVVALPVARGAER
jgi:excisionase family DNA binding protein